MTNFDIKFVKNKGKITLKASHIVKNTKFKLADVNTLSEVIQFILGEVSMNVYDIATEMISSLAAKSMGLEPKKGAKIGNLTHGKVRFSIHEGESIGQVLASKPQESILILKTEFKKFISDKFEAEFDKHLKGAK